METKQQSPEASVHLGERLAVLAHDPERARAHPRGADLREGVQEARHNGLAQLGVGLNDLAYEEDHVERRGGVAVAQEVHQNVDHAAGHVGELDGAVVDRLQAESQECLEFKYS
jgi:hypothetical protein